MGREKRTFVDKDNWDDYLEVNSTHYGYLDYLDANEEFVYSLNKMLKTAKSFKELKGQLTGLVEERKTFIKFAYKNLPD